MLSRLLSKIWLQHKLLQGYRGKSGGKLHKTMRGSGSRTETTCGRGGEMLSAGGRHHAGKKLPSDCALKNARASFAAKPKNLPRCAIGYGFAHHLRVP